MKLSVSLSDEDVKILDAYVRTSGLTSRSAALQRAVRMLRLPDLDRQYEAAFDEWESSGEQQVWESVASDGITRAAG